MPNIWGKELSTSEIKKRMEMIIKKSNDNFAFFRDLFIEYLIEMVMKEDDTVQKHVAASTATQRVCISCKKRYDILKFKCDACKSKVVKDKLDLNSTAKASGIDKG